MPNVSGQEAGSYVRERAASRRHGTSGMGATRAAARPILCGRIPPTADGQTVPPTPRLHIKAPPSALLRLQVVPARLGAVAAGRHVAPPAGAVLAGIDE